MADSRAGSPAIFDILFNAVYTLISLTTRTILRFGLTTALIASVLITLHHAGQFSKRALFQRQDGNYLNSNFKIVLRRIKLVILLEGAIPV